VTFSFIEIDVIVTFIIVDVGYKLYYV